MSQGFIGGATSYEEQSLVDILMDIKNWIDYTQNRKLFICEKKEFLLQCGFWNKIYYDFQLTIDSTISFFDTILHDLNIVKHCIETNFITQREVLLLRKIGQKANEYNREYAQTYRTNSRYWHLYGNDDFTVVEEIYCNGRDYFVTMQDVANASYRLEDYMTNGQMVNNTLTIHGSVTSSQIQQGTHNSTQTTTTTETTMDYEEILKVLYNIQQSSDLPMFANEFGDKSEEIKHIISEAIEMANKKEAPSKIQKKLIEIKNLSLNVMGGVISTGISTLIASFIKN